MSGTHKVQSAALGRFLGRLSSVRSNGIGYKALCPAHQDQNASLSVRETNRRILVKCFAGCAAEDICKALEFEIGDLFLDGRSRKRIVAEYSYTDEHGATLYQNVRFEPKDFRQRRPNGSGGWTWKLGNVRRVLYRLPEVLAAKEVLLVEGEKDADAARALGFMATSSGAAGTWRKEFSDPLCGKLVTIIADADDPGRKHAQRVARLLLGKAESLKLLELPGAKDLFEWVEHGGSRATLLDLIESTPEWKPQAVNGSTILDEVFGYIRRFVSLSESQARVVALWIFHTHLLSSAFSTPYLAITSAEKQSGKTRLLEVLETLVSNPWLTGKVTAAVLTRKIDAEQATLLLDESDAAFAGDKDYSEALRGVLNTGHRRGGKSSCCVGQGANISFRDFSTFSPKAIAGIGKLPDTVADRAIPIRLKRVAPGEGVERFRRREIDSEAARLRQNIATWSGLNAEKLSDARPTLPDALTDRQQDGAEPLLAIADAAGEEWPQIARRALIQLCSEAQACDESIGKLLLTDISQVFEALGADRLSSAGLASELAGIEISPWSEWSHGKPLTPARLARLLSPYGIVPHSIRIADKTPKGYEREDFKDAFRRYLRVKDTSLTLSLTSQSATPQQANTAAAFVDFSNCNTKLASPAKKCEIANENKPSCGVAVSDPATEAGHRGVEEDL